MDVDVIVHPKTTHPRRHLQLPAEDLVHEIVAGDAKGAEERRVETVVRPERRHRGEHVLLERDGPVEPTTTNDAILEQVRLLTCRDAQIERR